MVARWVSEENVPVSTLAGVSRCRGSDSPAGSRIPGTYVSAWLKVHVSRPQSPSESARSARRHNPANVSHGE